MILRPNVSILMSVYFSDSAEVLSVALQSLQKQTIKSNDLVVVLDGPVTKSIENVINEFYVNSNLPTTIHRLEQNQGLGKALRAGLLHTKNEIVFRADSDDISDPQRFEKELDFLLSNPRVSVVGSNVAEFKRNPKKIEAVRAVPESHEEIIKFARRRSPLNHPSVVFKKSAVIAAGNYQDFKSLEDYHLWGRMLNLGFVFANIPENLVFMKSGEEMYRRRGGFKYWRQYLKLRRMFTKWGLTNNKDELVANTMMTVNVLLPPKIRKKAYEILLRK